MRNAEFGMRNVRDDSIPARRFRIPHSPFRIRFCLVPIQPISWTPNAGVRVIDQRALPDAEIMRDLESAEAVADAIRTMQVRGAPLIGIAAAMGLVAALREHRTAPRAAFLARAAQVSDLLANARPTAVNLRWA